MARALKLSSKAKKQISLEKASVKLLLVQIAMFLLLLGVLYNAKAYYSPNETSQARPGALTGSSFKIKAP